VVACYLDDSGTDKRCPVITMGGYVARLEDWERFEEAADEYLNSFGVEVLHAKHFHDTDPPFANWSRQKKLDFIYGLYRLVREHRVALGLALSARKRRYKQRSFQLGLNKNTSAYGFCFTAILNRLLVDPILKPQIEANGLSFIIESGNKNNGDVEKTFHGIKREHHLELILRGLTFDDKRARAQSPSAGRLCRVLHAEAFRTLRGGWWTLRSARSNRRIDGEEHQASRRCRDGLRWR
jgi:hypothetical protein